MIPWRFGNTTQESCYSYLWVRIQAFISRAIFTSPVQVLAVGGPVVGFCEPTNGDCRSAQLVSWGPTATDNRCFLAVIPILDWIRGGSCHLRHSPPIGIYTRTTCFRPDSFTASISPIAVCRPLTSDFSKPPTWIRCCRCRPTPIRC